MEEITDQIITSSISFLPQDCISKIISFTTPRDAIRASAVSSGFKVASGADTTWEGFLPLDYEHIVSMSETPLNYSTKRELFFLLCNSPIFLDGGTKCFWLSKSSGKKCYMLCASELLISKKNSPRIWRWPSVPKSRFPHVALLLTIGLLHIQCNIRTEILSPRTDYAAYLVFRTTQNCYGLDSEFKGSVRLVAGSRINNNSDGYDIWSVYLTTPKHGSSSDPAAAAGDHHQRRISRKKELDLSFYPKKRMDGWMEIFLGEFLFLNHELEGDGEIEIQLYEKRKGVLKSGLVIEGIEIRPSFLSDA